MIIKIDKTKKFIGKANELNFTFSLPSGVCDNLGAKPLGDIALSGEYTFLNQNECEVYLDAVVFLDALCFRCSKSFVFEYKFNIDCVYSFYPNEDEYKLENNQLDLTQCILESFITQFPSLLICKQDCKGICPKCGINLNDYECNCKAQEDELNNPFSVLKQLK